MTPSNSALPGSSIEAYLNAINVLKASFADPEIQESEYQSNRLISSPMTEEASQQCLTALKQCDIRGTVIEGNWGEGKIRKIDINSEDMRRIILIGERVISQLA